MNEIEKKYFEAFIKYVKTNPKIILFNKTGYNNLYIEHSYDEGSGKDVGFIIVRARFKDPDDTTFFFTSLIIKSFADPINGYIPDFVVENTCFDYYKFVIEIDGHQWHEKTKEQALNDRKKDRAYLKNNIIPIRFTGAEVFHEPEACIRETLEVIGDVLLGYVALNFSENLFIKKGKE